MTEPKEDSIYNMTKDNKNMTAGYESIRQFFVKKNIMNTIGFLLIIYTIILIVRIVRSAVLNADFPNEYREVANIQLTLEFLKGNNPYSLEAYSGQVPGMIYVYGPLYSLFTAFCGLFIPIDIIKLHYIVTFVSVMIGAALAAYITYENTQYLAAPAAVFLFIINCSWRYGYINAVPDAFALMLTILIFFIVSRKDFKLKNPLCALLSVALFFAKQYFAIVAISVLIYKLINDRKDALKFFLQTFVIAAAAVIVVTVTCPLYWTYSVYMAHGPFGITQEQYHKAYGGYMKEDSKEEIEEAGKKKEKEEEISKQEGNELTNTSVNTDPDSGFGYEIIQLKSLIGIFIFIFIAAFAGFISELKSRFKNKAGPEFFLIIHIVVSFIALIYLGRNNGAWLSYYLQLLMPETIIYAFIITDRYINENDGLFCRLCLAYFIIMTFFTAYRTNGRLKVYEKTGEEITAWEKAYDITAKAAEKGEVYYVPPLGFQTFSNGQYLYNNGHNMVVTGWFRGEYFAVPWEQALFPYAGEVMKAHYNYQEHIKEKVKNGEYELVTIIPGMDTDFGRLNISDLENAGYRKKDEILLDSGRMSYEVQFWTR